MNSIITKKIENVRYTLGSPDSAKGRYNQIKGTFPRGKEHLIFAEPIILNDGRDIAWTTGFKGAIINYNKLSSEEQSVARKMLSKEIKKLFDAAKIYEDSSLSEFFYKCIEIPDLSNIYIVRKGDQEKIVLTEWGFVSDIPGAERGLLAKIINAKKIPMHFNVVYQDDDSKAVGVEINFEFEDEKEIHRSNDKGQIVLEEVKPDEQVKAFQLENGQPTNIQTYECYEEGRYKIKVPRILGMRFKVVNGKDQPLANLNFKFSFDNEERTLTTGTDGVMMLPNILTGTKVNTSHNSKDSGMITNSFVCETNRNEYLIIIKEKEYQMRFKVVNKKDKIIPNAEIKVKYNGKTATLFTDSEGYAILEGVEPGTKVEVIATKKKK